MKHLHSAIAEIQRRRLLLRILNLKTRPSFSVPIKYSFRERVIYVELSLSDKGVTISVSSFGKTVPLDFRESIFKKNVRGPNGIAQNPEGMGMGLFIARQITAAHGFKLFYESPEPDLPVGNNKFVLEIPLEAVTVE